MSKVIKLKEDQVTNGAQEQIDFSAPYLARIKIAGTADLLFHRYNCESVAEKNSAAKGSKSKKTDNIESYVYRNQEGLLCLPGESFRQSIITAAKFEQDPRSPRKSAMDLFKAAVISLTDLASLGAKEWDYEDRRRVMVQRSAITRVRPAMRNGWTVDLAFMVQLPEYVPPQFLRSVLDNAGRLVGVGDFRPSYGRYRVDSWTVENP